MSKLYNTAKKAFFEPIKKALTKETNIGKRITNISANVPKNALEKAESKLKIQKHKTTMSGAKLKQTQFEIDQADRGKGDYNFTFDPSKKNVIKKSIENRNEESKKMFKGAQGKAKGGRVGLKFGSKKSNVQKIKETFGPKKQLSAKQMKIAKLAGNPKKIDAQDLAKLRGRG